MKFTIKAIFKKSIDELCKSNFDQGCEVVSIVYVIAKGHLDKIMKTKSFKEDFYYPWEELLDYFEKLFKDRAAQLVHSITLPPAASTIELFGMPMNSLFEEDMVNEVNFSTGLLVSQLNSRKQNPSQQRLYHLKVL